MADISSAILLEDTLQVLFGLLASTMLPAKPNLAHQAIAEYASRHATSTVVTTNYDCCMDLALGTVEKDFNYKIEFTNKSQESRNGRAQIGLIKLHGSLNWYYCETCQESPIG